MASSAPPKKLLVVDDEPLVRETLTYVFQDDYDVVTVGSGEAAIEAVAREAFPVVILDLCMEGLSGIETLQQLKKIRESQNIIILTAYETTESAIEALNLGAFNYLTKPFERLHLKEVVARGFDLYEQNMIREQDLQNRLMGVHDSFFSMLCHEFNTPLNVILGFSQLLSTETKDPEHLSWVEHIKEAGDHLHDILMEIVDYTAAAHLAEAGVEKEFVPEELFASALQNLRERGVRVGFQSELPAEARLVGPSAALLSIVRKMLRMAVQRSKSISLGVSIDRQDGPHLKVVVGKTGFRREGTEGHTVKELFEPYHFKVNEDSSAAFSLGLELATCRKIADYAHANVDGAFDENGELSLVARIPVKMAD